VSDDDGGLLGSVLALAVPLRIAELLALSPPDRASRMALWQRESGQAIASHGDQILFRSKHRGETAEAFNHLARGLAVLAFAPGGVTFAGQHWQADG
jgi:hypothetical protein